MPANDQDSPRAKIRDWLSKTESKGKRKSVRGHPKYSNNEHAALLESRYPTHAAALSPRIRASTGKDHAFHSNYPARQESSHQRAAYESQTFEDDRFHEGELARKSKYQEHHVGDPAGSQRPFRVYGHDAQPTIETSQARKRRRTCRSVSSELQPAAIAECDCTAYAAKDLQDGGGAGHSHNIKNVESSANLSNVSHHSAIFFSSPERAPDTYERRRRHKTREDRYDIKHSIARQENTAGRPRKGERSGKTKRHKEKSGEALMQDFNAANVSSERLTLKPGLTAGLFRRGKASSPIKRRGLPDLAFSELTFLNTSRQKATEMAESASKEETKKGQKVKRVADMEAEISRYFTIGKTRKAGHAGAIGNRKHSKEEQHQQHESLHDSVPSIIDLPEKPFLGFGTSGANSVSPVDIVKELDAKYVPSRSQRDTRSLSRSTSYLTWSRSSAPPRQDDCEPATSRQKKPTVCQTPSFTGRESISGAVSASFLGNRAVGTLLPKSRGAGTAHASADGVANIADAVSRQGANLQIHNLMNCEPLQDANRVQSSHLHQHPDPDCLSALKVSQSGIPTTAAIETGHPIESKPKLVVKSTKPTVTLSSKPLANQEALETIQSTLNALLQACKPKFSNAATGDTGSDTVSKPNVISDAAMEEPGRIKQTSSHTIPKSLTLEEPGLEYRLQPLAQNAHFKLRDDPRRFDDSGQYDQLLPNLASEQHLIANNLDCRPYTADMICHQNLHVQRPATEPTSILKGYDAFLEQQWRGETKLVDRSGGYASDTGGSQYGDNNNFDMHGPSYATESDELPYAHPMIDESVAIDELEENWFNDAAQEKLVANHKIQLDETNANYQTASHYLNTAPPTPPARHHQSFQLRTSQGQPQYVNDLTVGGPQSIRFRADRPDSTFVEHTPAPKRAHRNDMLQTLPLSRIDEDHGIQPVGFWKPNRLY